MTTDTSDANAMIACAGCKRKFPPDSLGLMARLPLALAHLFHLTPGDEGKRLYCTRCRSSQNFGMVTLVLFGFAGLAGHWRPIATGIILLAWLAGSSLWILYCVCRAIHRRATGKHIVCHNVVSNSQQIRQVWEPMAFRRTRSSNDGYTWGVLAMASMILGSIAYVGYSVIPPGETTAKEVLSVILGLLAAAVLWCLGAIVFPRRWEIVVENNQIRWGRVDKPWQQKYLRIEQIQRLIHDRYRRRIYADIGGLMKLPWRRRY